MVNKNNNNNLFKSIVEIQGHQGILLYRYEILYDLKRNKFYN